MSPTPSSTLFTIKRQGDLPPLVISLPKGTLHSDDVRDLRTQAETELRAGRQAWYEHQARKIQPELLASSVSGFAQRFLEGCELALSQAALHGKQSITGCILNPIATQGWKFATYGGPDHVWPAVQDLSMNVLEHQMRVLGAEVIHQALVQRGFRCELYRNPETGPDCFVDEIRLTIFT